MTYEEDNHLREVDKSIRLRQSLLDGVFYDEFGNENPHVGFAKCIHGELVTSNCEKCNPALLEKGQ